LAVDAWNVGLPCLLHLWSAELRRRRREWRRWWWWRQSRYHGGHLHRDCDRHFGQFHCARNSHAHRSVARTIPGCHVLPTMSQPASGCGRGGLYLLFAIQDMFISPSGGQNMTLSHYTRATFRAGRRAYEKTGSRWDGRREGSKEELGGKILADVAVGRIFHDLVGDEAHIGRTWRQSTTERQSATCSTDEPM